MNRPLLACSLALGVAAVGLFVSRAAVPAEVPVVGMLVTHAVVNDPGDALRAALRQYGYEEGRNIRFEIVTAAGELDRLPGLAEDLVHHNVAVIAAKRARAGAVMLLGSPMFYVHRTRVAALALGEGLPTVSMINQAVEAGALLSYGQDLAEVWQRTAYFVDRLLKGATPSDLPVEQVSRLRLAVNLRTAKALGITIPESILLRANEVIR